MPIRSLQPLAGFPEGQDACVASILSAWGDPGQQLAENVCFLESARFASMTSVMIEPDFVMLREYEADERKDRQPISWEAWRGPEELAANTEKAEASHSPKKEPSENHEQEKNDRPKGNGNGIRVGAVGKQGSRDRPRADTAVKRKPSANELGKAGRSQPSSKRSVDKCYMDDTNRLHLALHQLQPSESSSTHSAPCRHICKWQKIEADCVAM